MGAALTRRDVPAANAGIRRLFTSVASADQTSTRKAAAAAVRAYNRRLRQIARLSARISRERQEVVAKVG